MSTFEVTIEGHPEPGGSKSAFPLKHRGTGEWMHDAKGRPLVNVVDANPKAKAWKEQCGWVARSKWRGEPLEGPLIVEMTFYVRRPKNHYGTGRNARLLRDTAPLFPATNPDLLKLARTVEDGLTGVVWADDGQIVDEMLRERYCDRHSGTERVEVRVLAHQHATVGEKAAAAQMELVA